ncbi:MAG: HAD family hydrolase, partial [Bacteroidota bacterium]
AAWMIALLGKVVLSFDVMITAADVARTKPDPEPFRKVLERLHLSPREVLAIGDAPYDAQSATAAGIPCVGVLTGGFSEEELLHAGAWMVVEDIGELLQGIDSLLASLNARMAA